MSSKTWKIALLLAGALLLTACGNGAEEEESVDPVAVEITRAGQGEIAETFSFSGEVSAGGEIQIVPKVSGTVSKVNVALGDTVQQGDVLVELEARELALAVQQAEAAVEMARANLNSMEAGSGLSQLQANVRQAEINFNRAGEQLERMEALYAEGGLAKQQLEDVRASFAVAQTQYELASDQLQSHERGEGQLEILTAQLKQAEAGLELARLNYQNATITAPVGGTVTLVHTEAGNMVSPGTPVVTLINAEGTRVTALLTEQAVNHIAVGMEIAVEIPTLEGRYQGEVREISPGAVSGTRSFLVKVTLVEEIEARPGMFARLILVRDSRDDAVVLPRSAILENDGSYYIYLVKDEQAVRTDVTIGLRDETHAEIEAGVTVGDKVVITGHHFLRDGVAVQVEGEQS
ncbi:efflux RND transporter periplasmic adaptor subunit [Dethiobacter alkaliphilus]|uniref:Efflux transporter, RND family, MFP subunit n=1 Tax=Dethiobacter alkaliphilus AHT 1 TaxID=555088 RepID=C0GIH1_DETAL|nr:efflux RND transporter periplasmic adaptor subunit [Dethiobacter alkaliphilus]EEG76832.1 efflux transporter, RND family, MFP subunit [Dethiobacter alkaliphilus AHT 1]